jgi:uncharacterized membrane protein
MQILKHIFFDFGPVVFGFAGFVLAGYISLKKLRQQPLVCPLNGECDAVTTSKYARFLGIPVERIGVAYYLLIVLVYGLRVIAPAVISDTVMFLATALTIGAFIFSVYLVFIQAFVLRKWCTWCLYSAAFSTFIFITAVVASGFDVTPFLAEYRTVIIVIHALAAAVGVGAATVTDVFFFRFLKDYRISESEQALMTTMSNIIWLALGVIIISGIGLFIPESERLLASSKFLTKVVAVGVVLVNGTLLNLIVSPKMMSLDFSGASDGVTDLRGMRRLSYALGGISIASWYLVFILGSLKSIPFSFGTAVVIYVLVLVGAVCMGQIMDWRTVRGYKKDHSDGGDKPPAI